MENKRKSNVPKERKGGKALLWTCTAFLNSPEEVLLTSLSVPLPGTSGQLCTRKNWISGTFSRVGVSSYRWCGSSALPPFSVTLLCRASVSPSICCLVFTLHPLRSAWLATRQVQKAYFSSLFVEFHFSNQSFFLKTFPGLLFRSLTAPPSSCLQFGFFSISEFL